MENGSNDFSDFWHDVLEGYLEENHRAWFWNKNRTGPKSGLEGPKTSKNGVFVILFDNGSNDLLDFLCVVKSIWGLSISRGPMVKIKSGWPEIGPEGPKRLMNGVLVIFLANNWFNFFSGVQSRYGISNSTVLMMKKFGLARNRVWRWA